MVYHTVYTPVQGDIPRTLENAVGINIICNPFSVGRAFQDISQANLYVLLQVLYKMAWITFRHYKVRLPFISFICRKVIQRIFTFMMFLLIAL